MKYNWRKTLVKCKNNHPFNNLYTYLCKKQWRHCRICRANNQRKYRRKFMVPDAVKKDILRKRSALDRYKRALIRLTKAGIVLEGSLKPNLMDDELTTEYKLSRISLIRYLGYRLEYSNRGGHFQWKQIETNNADMVQANQVETTK